MCQINPKTLVILTKANEIYCDACEHNICFYDLIHKQKYAETLDLGTNITMEVDISRQLIYYVSKDNKIMKCNNKMVTDKTCFAYPLQNDQITAMKLSCNQEKLLTLQNKQHTLVIYDTDIMEKITMIYEQSEIQDFDLSPDDSMLVTATEVQLNIYSYSTEIKKYETIQTISLEVKMQK